MYVKKYIYIYILLTIALNVLYVKKYIYIYPAYVSKQVILLMIPNGEKHEATFKGCRAKSKIRRRWHYLAAKKTQHY